MGAFDLDVPNWGRIPPVRVTGPAAVDAAGVVSLPTSAGVLRVSLHDCGVRCELIGQVSSRSGSSDSNPAEYKAEIDRNLSQISVVHSLGERLWPLAALGLGVVATVALADSARRARALIAPSSFGVLLSVLVPLVHGG